MQLREIPLGNSDIEGNEFWRMGFDPDQKAYKPWQSSDDLNNRYVVWRTDLEEAKEQLLEQARDEVVAAWKQIEARKLAEEKAKELLSEARSADNRGLTLTEVFAEDEAMEVMTSQPFTYATRGAVPKQIGRSRIHLSVIDGIEGADGEFMDKVFALKAGEVDQAANHAQSEVYVLRLAQRTKSEDQLRDEFLKMASSGGNFAAPRLSTSQASSQLFQRAFGQSAFADAEVEWVEQPAQP